MSYGFISFLLVAVVVLSVFLFFVRGSLVELSKAATARARANTAGYTRTMCFVALAVFIAFDDSFKPFAKDAPAMAELTWIGWTLLYLKPIAAGLNALAAAITVNTSTSRTDPNQPPP